MPQIINPLQQGTILHGKSHDYMIVKVLGQGSFGITYLASINLKGKLGSIATHVAIKEFFMSEVNGRNGSMVTCSNKDGLFDKYKKKFIKEAQNLSKLNHERIIKVMESFEANNTVYYTMEYLSEGSLDEYIAKKGRLKEGEALYFADEIASALSFMHSKNMLHLDLKPGNTMLKNGQAVLIDFGLSKQFDKKGNPESSTTVGGGTPGYAPTEQTDYQGDHRNGLPVTMDIYALGGTMFKMLTGNTPPKASIILNDGFPREVLQARGVTNSTIDLIERAMAPKRKDRIATTDIFRQELRPLLNATAIEEDDTIEAILAEPEDNRKVSPIQHKPAPKLTQPQKKVTTNEHNGHQYVDLGLSVKWATCNVGASKPEEYGDYFAWGETKPKTIYKASNCVTWNKSISDINGKLNQDAARTIWGGEWRLPTRAELNELIEKCSWKWSTQNGVKGYKVTSKSNKNSIFLPAAGYRDGESICEIGSNGYLWSSTPYHKTQTFNSFRLNFSASQNQIHWTLRFRGFTIRPVIPSLLSTPKPERKKKNVTIYPKQKGNESPKPQRRERDTTILSKLKGKESANPKEQNEKKKTLIFLALAILAFIIIAIIGFLST